MSSPPSGSDGEAKTSSTFELYHPEIRRWIWEHRWTELHQIQEQAARPILEGKRDVIITAATAGGKTEAAFFPILTRVAESPASGIRVLYVSPLKALINDQFDRLSELGGRLEIAVHRWHGDVSASAKRKLLASPAGVLLITPESLEALFVLRGTILPRLLAGLTYIVVDELHSFIGTERGRHLQSLLHRVEVSTSRTIPRVAMSATLGDMLLAADHLRPGKAEEVVLVASDDDGFELKLLLRGYRKTAPPLGAGKEAPSGGNTDSRREDEIAIAGDLFSALRGTHNLVFANSRGHVEFYADRLRRLCEEGRLPQEFWAHHGNISKEYREDAERALKDGSLPATVVCTTTLELGIDIGSVKSVAQVGAPPSVASLRQRLGRSGRRGEPAILRFYVSERELGETSSPEDALRVELVQSVAMIRLLLQSWYEPPISGMLHLSTLLQQVLSLIAERGGTSALKAWDLLCRSGPFRSVERSVFVSVLRDMADSQLIEQAHDGTLLLGQRGERIVNHHSFYAVFATPAEYRLFSGGKQIGTLPMTHPVQAEMHLIFAARRWRVLSVDETQRVIDLAPAPGGKVPLFSGTPGLVHDRVRQEMFRVCFDQDRPAFLDGRARELLREARDNFFRFGLDGTCLLSLGSGCSVFVWAGDRVRNTLLALLVQRGFSVASSGLTLSIAKATPEQVADHLSEIAASEMADGATLAHHIGNRLTNKYDEFLSPELLAMDYAAREMDTAGALRFIRDLVENGFRPPLLPDETA